MNWYDNGIRSDAAILASVVTDADLVDGKLPDSDDLWKRFKAAGGDDGHSGASWSFVRAAAVNLLTEKAGN